MKLRNICWDYWNEQEIDSVGNGCWSTRWLFRPPQAKKNRLPCNFHDVRYAYGWGILDKFWADFMLFVNILYDNLTNVWFYWLGNVYWILMSVLYFIWVWVFGTIIDVIAMLLLWKKPAFAFWVKKTKKEILKSLQIPLITIQ